MPIKVQWFDEEKTGIHIQYIEHWTWDQFHEATMQARELFDSIDHRVVLIIDLCNSEMMPGGSILHIRRAQNIRHDNMGKVFIVGANTFMQMVGGLAMRLNRRPRNAYFASSLDDVRQKLSSASGSSNNSHQE